MSEDFTGSYQENTNMIIESIVEVMSQSVLPTSATVPAAAAAVDTTLCWSPDAVAKTEVPIKKEEQDQDRGIGGILKVCGSHAEALQLIQAEEKATGMHFVGHRKEGIFDMTGSDMKEFVGEGRKHIKYSVSIETKGRGCNPVPVSYTGVPFIEAGTYVLECHMGNDSGMWNKRKYAANRNKNEQENGKMFVRRRIRSHGTKKLGCPTKVHIKRIIKLPDFKIKQNTSAERNKNRMKIILALKDDLERVSFQSVYYILLPYVESHKYHVVDFVAGVMVPKEKDTSLHLQHIRKYLETGAYLSSVKINEKKNIRIAAKAFTIEEEQMYYIGKDGSEKRAVLYTEDEKYMAFEKSHILRKSGDHFDCTSTVYNLAEKYYWTSMAEDVVVMVNNCDICKLNKRNTSREPTANPNQQYPIVYHHEVHGLKKHNTSLHIRKNSSDKYLISKSDRASSCKVANCLASAMKNKLCKRSSLAKRDVTVEKDNPIGIIKVVGSYEEVMNLIMAEEKATGMHFVGHRKEGIFDIIGSDMRTFAGEGRKHIKYSVGAGTKGRGYDPMAVEYTGVPFIEAGTYIMECHMGNDSGMWNKRRYAANRDKIEEQNHITIKRRILTQKTKKMGCPAKIHIKRILRMPDFKLKRNTKTEKEKNRLRIVKALKEEIENVNFQSVYYVMLPEVESHKFHAVDVVGGVRVQKGRPGLQHLQHVRHYLQTGTHLSYVQKKSKNSIRRSSKEFIIEGTTMYYIGKDRTERRIVPHLEMEREEAFEKCHILKSGHHCDRTETLRRLVEKYYWTGITEDVFVKIEQCKACGVNKLLQCDQNSVPICKPENVQLAMAKYVEPSPTSSFLPEGQHGHTFDTESVEIIVQEQEPHQDLSCRTSYSEDQQASQTTFGSIHKLDDGGHLVVIADDTLDLES
nr:uncharacterized protein LOC123765466 isoform X1 [Procambarus clarkii]XP_045610013.1 uncharacterized protein LOC123765466 isoform X1 [Procambarus clarkii]XP_045610014.1 uncharacterized protein LOC123765466 isoform X1 [Procambarus clarkii]XP_045610015.1 uncharacterized protein LOC123765466 isoform X1 [Procambarus clarkii]XP_045610017.1 uncharacterized protein LOC123765466 isoform X1 [Procambarus clarkii]XP_045610018.1 uncharacterized protein LOC123765466 isoform X1 [Procambarus clarkii]